MLQYIKIPKNINLFYNRKKNLLVFENKNKYKLLKTDLKLIIDKKKRLFITKVYQISISVNYKKQLIFFQKLLLLKIKQIILNLMSIYYQKLKFIGIGYRAITISQTDKQTIFLLKLGVSHPLYLSTDNLNIKTKMFCFKSTKLFVFSSSFEELTQITAKIRLKKRPEPYKGKGILLDNEKIELKEGKKI